MLKIKRNPYLFLLLFSLLVFAPIWFSVFSIKNDLLTGYFPVRFFLSESINAGYIPWWNPYVNFGIPQHADMSGGFWNPVTWLISLTAGYNIYTINLEALFYVLIGGMGMYRLGKLWNWNTEVKLVIAISYMCCGYFIGNLQHLNWISGAGYLPWCYYFYIQLLHGYNHRKLLQNIFAFSLLVTSSHPGILIGSIYFFLLVTGNHVTKELKSKKLLSEILWEQKQILLLLLLLLLTNSALIISYAEILPYITRDVKPIVNSTGTEATSFQSLISFLLPFATVKGGSFYMSDVALRNCYFGLVPFIFTITAFYFNIKNRSLGFFFIAAVFFLFLSTGSLLQAKIYSLLPLISYVRLPAEFRIFALFCLLLYSGTALNNYAASQQNRHIPQRITAILIIVIGVLFAFSLIKIVTTRLSIIYYTTQIADANGIVLKLKSIIDNLSLYDVIFIQSSISILLLFFVYKSIRSGFLKTLRLLAVVDIFLATVLHLPFTGYGKLPQAEIQEIINSAPKGIPIPNLHPIAKNNLGIAGIDSILGKWSLYNKQPGSTEQALYPIIFKSEQHIFKKDSMKKIAQHPFLFFIPDLNDSLRSRQESDLKILHYSPSSIQFSLQTNEPGKAVLLYKYFRHWEVFVNEQKSPAELYNNSFLSIPLKSAGQHIIHFRYNPSLIRNIFLFQVALLLLALILLIRLYLKQ